MKTTLLMRLMLRLVRGDTECVLLEVIDYLMAESCVLRKKYEQDCGKRLLLCDQQRWELATRGRAVVTAGYAHVIGIVKPDTLMRWYRKLVARKFDSSRVLPRKQGRPEIPPHVSKLILRFARENRSWGYDRIVGALANLGHARNRRDVRRQQGARGLFALGLAYYTLQRLKSGRRSTGSGRTDVMSPACRLDGNCSLTSMDEPLRAGDDGEEPTLGDAIAGRGDDPCQMAVRNADWSEFMAGLDGAQRYIVRATAEGESLNDQAARLQVSPPAVCQRRHTIGRRARQFWGDTVLADAQTQPLWRRQMQPR